MAIFQYNTGIVVRIIWKHYCLLMNIVLGVRAFIKFHKHHLPTGHSRAPSEVHSVYMLLTAKHLSRGPTTQLAYFTANTSQHVGIKSHDKLSLIFEYIFSTIFDIYRAILLLGRTLNVQCWRIVGTFEVIIRHPRM